MPVCGSPWLFAAYRVLLRQTVPWHPPCALVRLICLRFAALLRPLRRLNGSSSECLLRSLSLCSFQGAGAFHPFDRAKGLKLCHCPANLQSDTVKEYSRTVDSSLAFFLWLFASPVCLPAFPRMSFASARPRSLRSASAPLCSFRPRVMLRLSAFAFLPRKEVIQPHLPIRLPCYDFTPVIGLTFGS